MFISSKPLNLGRGIGVLAAGALAGSSALGAASRPVDATAIVSFSTDLTDSNGSLAGGAAYGEHTSGGTLFQVLKIEIVHQAPQSDLKVIVNGIVSGVVTTDSQGAGSARLAVMTNLPFTTSGIPQIRNGTIMTIGNAIGKFH